MYFTNKMEELKFKRCNTICEYFEGILEDIFEKLKESEECSSVTIYFEQEISDVIFTFLDGGQNFKISDNIEYHEILAEYDFENFDEYLRFISDFVYYVYMNTEFIIKSEKYPEITLKIPILLT